MIPLNYHQKRKIKANNKCLKYHLIFLINHLVIKICILILEFNHNNNLLNHLNHFRNHFYLNHKNNNNTNSHNNRNNPNNNHQTNKINTINNNFITSPRINIIIINTIIIIYILNQINKILIILNNILIIINNFR